jgi:hypothetical protein
MILKTNYRKLNKNKVDTDKIAEIVQGHRNRVQNYNIYLLLQILIQFII